MTEVASPDACSVCGEARGACLHTDPRFGPVGRPFRSRAVGCVPAFDGVVEAQFLTGGGLALHVRAPDSRLWHRDAGDLRPECDDVRAPPPASPSEPPERRPALSALRGVLRRFL